MKLKSGKTYRVRILQVDNHFYPQIFIKSFWHTGWYFIDTNWLFKSEFPSGFTVSLREPYTRFWNESLKYAEEVIRAFKRYSSSSITEIHNERDEQF